jgi:hypothetical protein
MYRPFFYCLSVLLLLPLPSQAAPAITCHCFKDRAYDASRPTLADPYFLATTQNSLFAVLFNVDKKTIMMKKQSGSTAEDLWVAYWLAARTGQSGETLLAERGKKESWKAVIVPMKLSAKILGDRFVDEVHAGAPSGRLAQMIIDDVLLQYRLIGSQDLNSLRKGWASNQEIIMAVLIAAKTGRAPLTIYRNVKNGSKSWGALLTEANIQPPGIQPEFIALLKQKK